MSDLHEDVLERRLRTACHQVIPRLADELDDLDVDDRVIDAMPTAFSDTRGKVIRLDTVRPRPRRSGITVLAGAAAAALVVVGALALLQRNNEPESTAGNGGAGTSTGFDFETPTVSLRADSIAVINGDRTFTPTGARVDSDPGDSTYTTLELTWFEDAAEQRINMYFASDGTNWWATEIRTYDTTRAQPDWYEPFATGPFFTTPLGTAYTGDVNLPNLRITGMTLQAFVPPAACTAPATPIALVADYPTITAGPGDFGATLQVIDTTSCTALPVTSYTFEYTTEDPSVAAILHSDTAGIEPTSLDTKTHLLLRLIAPGQTTIHATANDAGGTIVGSTTMQITVTDPSGNSAPSTTALNGNVTGSTTGSALAAGMRPLELPDAPEGLISAGQGVRPVTGEALQASVFVRRDAQGNVVDRVIARVGSLSLYMGDRTISPPPNLTTATSGDVYTDTQTVRVEYALGALGNLALDGFHVDKQTDEALATQIQQLASALSIGDDLRLGVVGPLPTGWELAATGIEPSQTASSMYQAFEVDSREGGSKIMIDNRAIDDAAYPYWTMSRTLAPARVRGHDGYVTTQSYITDPTAPNGPATTHPTTSATTLIWEEAPGHWVTLWAANQTTDDAIRLANGLVAIDQSEWHRPNTTAPAP